jgi:hypothetical protein
MEPTQLLEKKRNEEQTDKGLIFPLFLIRVSSGQALNIGMRNSFFYTDSLFPIFSFFRYT